jgi:hypothetical protein
MPDPWNLGLSTPMRQALFALNENGKLYRWAGTFGAEPLGRQFQEQTILSLIERGLVCMVGSQRNYRQHYAKLSAVGRLFAAQQKRFGGLKVRA